MKGGQPVPPEWPDPLRAADKGAPDIGALPLGAEVWGVGVDGRLALLGGAKTLGQSTDELLDFLLRVASGEVRAKNELNGFREITIFKTGVTL